MAVNKNFKITFVFKFCTNTKERCARVCVLFWSLSEETGESRKPSIRLVGVPAPGFEQGISRIQVWRVSIWATVLSVLCELYSDYVRKLRSSVVPGYQSQWRRFLCKTLSVDGRRLAVVLCNSIGRWMRPVTSDLSFINRFELRYNIMIGTE